MFCIKCGNKVPDGYAFCDKCGAKIEPPINSGATQRGGFGDDKTQVMGNSNAASDTTKVMTSDELRGVNYGGNTNYGGNYYGEDFNNTGRFQPVEPRKKSGAGKVVAIVAVAIVVILLAVGCVEQFVFGIGPFSNNGSDDSETPQIGSVSASNTDVDTSNYPVITFKATILDEDDNAYEGLAKADVTVTESPSSDSNTTFKGNVTSISYEGAGIYSITYDISNYSSSDTYHSITAAFADSTLEAATNYRYTPYTSTEEEDDADASKSKSKSTTTYTLSVEASNGSTLSNDVTYKAGEEYLLPDSDTHGYTVKEIKKKKFNGAELCIARNEIYARHNHDFKNSGLEDFFLDHITDYSPDNSVSDGELTKAERATLDSITEVQNSNSSYKRYLSLATH